MVFVFELECIFMLSLGFGIFFDILVHCQNKFRISWLGNEIVDRMARGQAWNVVYVMDTKMQLAQKN